VLSNATNSRDPHDRALRNAIELHREEWRIGRNDHDDGTCATARIICWSNYWRRSLPRQRIVRSVERAAIRAEALSADCEPVATAVIRLHEDADRVAAEFGGEFSA
jgi:hypothetical protein